MSQLTASNLITSISAVSSPITAIRGANTLKIAAPKASTWAWDCAYVMLVKSHIKRKIQKVLELETLQAYSSSSHHFRLSMSWSQYIVKRWKYTDHCYTETVSSRVTLKSQSLLQYPSTLSWKHYKLTAVPLITSIRACPGPSTSWRGGNTLAIATPKLGGATS